MRKYVKPMMESEAFVANEYVSACWTMECTNSTKGSCGEEEIKDTMKYSFSSFSSNYPGTFDVSKYDDNTYLGNFIGQIDEKTGCTDKATWKDYGFDGNFQWEDLGRIGLFLYDLIFGDTQNHEFFHPVKITRGWEGHPNASI